MAGDIKGLLKALDKLDVNATDFGGALSAFLAAVPEGAGVELLRAMSISGIGLEAALGLPYLAAVRIGGRDIVRFSAPFTPMSESVVTDGGKLGDCDWSLEVGTQAKTEPDPNRPNCYFHYYKTVVVLKLDCPSDANDKERKSERITCTGPHCHNPAAQPPEPVPAPRRDARLVGTGPDASGNRRTITEQPDGTKTTTTVSGSSVSVQVEYPDGTSVTLTVP